MDQSQSHDAATDHIQASALNTMEAPSNSTQQPGIIGAERNSNLTEASGPTEALPARVYSFTAAQTAPDLAAQAIQDPSAPAPRPPQQTVVCTGMQSTLAEAMRAPGVPPEVLVPKDRHEPEKRDNLNPQEDLWLSSADGRFSSPIIPIRVGVPPDQEVFYIHKNVIVKSRFFDRALCGNFKEASEQSIDLPEEDPSIFHFVVAFLYEGTYNPIRPIADLLIANLDSEKIKSDVVGNDDSDSDSAVAANSDSSAQSRARIERRRRRHERRLEDLRRKHPGQHRPDCDCRTCQNRDGLPCWHCHAPRTALPPAPPGGTFRDYMPRRPRRIDRNLPQHARGNGLHFPVPPPPPPPHLVSTSPPRVGESSTGAATVRDGLPPSDPTYRNERIRGEDMRTWLLTFKVNLQAYISADRYMLDGMKMVVSRHTVDMLETAGLDAAVYELLEACETLSSGLSLESDPLLKMLLARVGFMLPELQRRAPEKTKDFMRSHTDIMFRIMMETTVRREEEMGHRTVLPPLERRWSPATPGAANGASGLGPEPTVIYGDPNYRRFRNPY